MNPGQTIAGTSSVVELRPRRERDAQGVWRTIRTWRGTREDIQAFMGTFNLGCSLQERLTEGVFGELEATFSDAQDGTTPNDAANISTTWTFTANDLNTDILQIPEFLTGVPNASERKAIRTWMENPKDANPPTLGTNPSVTSTEGVLFFDSVVYKGVTAKVSSQIVLRRVNYIGRNNSTRFMENVGRTFTRQQLIDRMSTLGFPIPAAVTADMPVGSYLKKAPSKEEQSDGSFLVTTEFWHADYIPALLYPAADLNLTA